MLLITSESLPFGWILEDSDWAQFLSMCVIYVLALKNLFMSSAHGFHSSLCWIILSHKGPFQRKGEDISISHSEMPQGEFCTSMKHLECYWRWCKKQIDNFGSYMSACFAFSDRCGISGLWQNLTLCFPTILIQFRGEWVLTCKSIYLFVFTNLTNLKYTNNIISSLVDPHLSGVPRQTVWTSRRRMWYKE